MQITERNKIIELEDFGKKGWSKHSLEYTFLKLN